MPRGDGTGPESRGAMTGRGAGYCGGHGMPGYANAVPGYGLGMGRGAAWGRGRGWRNRYYATGLPGWARFGYAPAWGAPPIEAYGPYAAAPTKEQEMVRNAVRSFAEDVLGPGVQERDELEEYPTDLVEGMAKLNLFGLTCPPQGGSGGISPSSSRQASKPSPHRA